MPDTRDAALDAAAQAIDTVSPNDTTDVKLALIALLNVCSQLDTAITRALVALETRTTKAQE